MAVPGDRLDMGDAIHDGWLAFCRAPRLFVAFSLLFNLLVLGLQVLMGGIGSVNAPSHDPRDWGLYLLGLGLTLVLHLWARLALVRSAWLALQGRRPTLMDLLRWDGPAMLRLLRSWLRLAGLILLPAALAGLLFGLPLLVLMLEPGLQARLGSGTTQLLGLVLAALLLIGLALSLVSLLITLVNQLFLLPVVLLEKLGGASALERGRRLVHPQWPLVLLLLILESLLYGLGLLACVVGLLAAWPLVLCISTAAYRQLISAERSRNTATADQAAEPLPEGA
ncbi:MAG: hypothetical protein WCF98_05475 [Synechococcus sp. ELA057]